MTISTSIIAMLFVETVNATTSMALMPVLPFYVMQMGADAFDIALQGTVFNLTQMIFAPVVGSMSDRMGRKRILIAVALGSAFVNFMQAKAVNLTQILFVRAMGGFVSSGGPVYTAYLMEETSSEEELCEVLVLQRLVVTIGAILGPLIAKIFWYWSFQTLCYGMICTNILGAVIGLLFYAEHLPPEGTSPRSPPRSGSPQGIERTRSFTLTPKVLSPAMVSHRSSRWWRLLMGRETGILILGSMAFNFSMGVTEGPEVVFFKDYFGYNQGDMSDLLLVSCLAALVLTPFLPTVQSLLGERESCVIGTVGVSLCTFLLIMGNGHKWVPCFCSGLSVGLFGSMTGLGFMAMVHGCCPKDRLGTFLGIKSFFDSLAGTLSPAFGGWLYTRDHFLPYGLSVGLTAATSGIFASFAPLQEKPKAINKEEVEPMIGKELESDEEEGEAMTSLTTENLPFSKSTMMLKLVTNEMGILMDEQLGNYFYSKNNFKAGGIRRSATIGVENFISAADGRTPLRARQLRNASTKPELPDPMSPVTERAAPSGNWQV